MRVLPERVNTAWIETLSDDDLLDVEERVHKTFATLERREKKLRGDRFQLMRGPEELLNAWDRWSRLLNATRERSLKPRKPVVEA